MQDIKCKNCTNLRNDWCKEVVDSPDPDLKRNCKYFQARTNADRIRQMTDDELAAKFCTVFIHCCDWCPILGFCDDSETATCVDTWLDWLKREEG